jgi:RsiW-degrading membrane proteinase PrsW (M82 family)
VGPIDEETIKVSGVALLLVIYRSRIRRPLQAFALGAFAGLGFQMLENLTYATTFAFRAAQSDVAGALSTTVVRGLMGFQSHWVYTGLFAAGLAMLPRKPWFTVLGALLAYGLHGLWNAPGAGLPVLVLVILLAKCLLTLAVLAGVWTAMLFEHRRWLRYAVNMPAAIALAPPAELAALPTRAQRCAAVAWVRYYYGPGYAEVAGDRQRMLLRQLVYRVG